MASDTAKVSASPPKRKPGYKLVLLGEASVGKSSLVQRFVSNKFTEGIEATIGAAFSTREIKANGRDYKLEIWDTAGQERFRSLAPMYYRSAAAAIVVYDLTNPDSFEAAKTWVKQLEESQASRGLITLLAGNKSDVGGRQVSEADAQAFADAKGILSVECSAKTGENVFQMFERIARQLPDEPTKATRKTGSADSISNLAATEETAGGNCNC